MSIRIARKRGPRWGDFRDTTHAIRKAIGFKKKRDAWKRAPAFFSKHALRILGHSVMEDWEKPYMRALARIAASNRGVVLEIGFGMGISAGFIQKTKIKQHIIIEMNHTVAEKAQAFARHAKRPVIVLEGLWEEVINQIPDNSLDGILFDTYPLSEPELHKNHFRFFKTAYKKLKRGGVFTYYSDEIDSYRPIHIQKLIDAGFHKKNIQGEVVPVRPPRNCEYWKSDNILAPVVRKA